MSHQEVADSQFSKWLDPCPPLDDDLEMVRLSAARARAIDEASATIARQLNGPLTALLLYMGEIKQHSHQFSRAGVDQSYLEKVIDNALQQTECVCAMIKQIANAHDGNVEAPGPSSGWEKRAGLVRLARTGARTPGVMVASSAGQKPLTRREREVLNLIS